MSIIVHTLFNVCFVLPSFLNVVYIWNFVTIHNIRESSKFLLTYNSK